MTLSHAVFYEPGHFHAALTFRTPNPRLAPDIHVYATPGPERQAFVTLVESFNTRAAHPTHWRLHLHEGPQLLQRLVADGHGDFVVAMSHGLEDVDASRRAFPQVWSCDTYGALGSRGVFEPEWYIDISAVWERKLQALAAHQSQTPAHWTGLIRRHNAFYGARCNRPYAEGFRRLPLAFVNNLPAYAYLP
jgi:hypothetical protein